MLDSPPTCHKHNCLMGYQYNCNTGGPGFDSTLKNFFHIYLVAFIQNSGDHKGEAVFVSNHSIALLDKNSKIRFNYNKVTRGTVYSKTSSCHRLLMSLGADTHTDW